MCDRNTKGQFVENMTPWNKGIILKEQPSKICVECNNLFYKSSQYSNKQWETRMVCSNECKKTLRSKTFRQSDEAKEKNRVAHLGKVTMSGATHYNWKGGITSERTKAYFSKEYKEWRTTIFKRDNYTCQICNIKGGCLNADHIKPWAFYPELRYDLDNGRTLCVSCHRKTPTWGNRKQKNDNL